MQDTLEILELCADNPQQDSGELSHSQGYIFYLAIPPREMSVIQKVQF